MYYTIAEFQYKDAFAAYPSDHKTTISLYFTLKRQVLISARCFDRPRRRHRHRLRVVDVTFIPVAASEARLTLPPSLSSLLALAR